MIKKLFFIVAVALLASSSAEANITGIVIDSVTREPVQGAQATLLYENEWGYWSQHTFAASYTSGAFTLNTDSAPIPATLCEVDIWKYEYLLKRIPIPCSPNQSLGEIFLDEKQITITAQFSQQFPTDGSLDWSLEILNKGKPVSVDLYTNISATSMTSYYTMFGWAKTLKLKSRHLKVINDKLLIPEDFPKLGYICVNYIVTPKGHPLRALEAGGFCVYESASTPGKG